jgi:peptide/nickel transport system permease protein
MNFFQSDFVQNLWPFVTVAALAFAIWHAGKQPLWAEAYRRLRRNRVAIFSVFVILAFGLVAFLDSVGTTDKESQTRVSVLDKIAQRSGAMGVRERTYSAPLASVTSGEPQPRPLTAPGKHLLGTDGTGQDVLYRSLKGARTAFLIGGLTLLISTPLALLFGLMAGYYGKWVDDAIQYVYGVLSSIPSILLLIALILVLGNGVFQICIALGITSWVGLCRLARGETLKHRDREYVRAARALGVSDLRILFRHILPNLLPIVIISTTLGFSGLVLSESILSYLGLGVGAEIGSWGNMIDAARDELSREPVIWWNLVGASSFMFVLVLAFNLLGDALRDAIDPRLRS